MVHDFVHDFLRKLDSHHSSRVLDIGGRGDVGKDDTDQRQGLSVRGLDGYMQETGWNLGWKYAAFLYPYIL